MTAQAVLHPAAGLASTRALGLQRATVPTALGRAGEVAGDVALLLLLILCVPVAILAVGIPIALLLQMVLWLSRLAG